jgi:lysophospholipase L1-like esterase
MKPKQVFVFILATIATLGILGFVFPRGGVQLFIRLKFIHPYDILNPDTTKKLDLDTYLNNVFKQFQSDKIMGVEDSLKYYMDFHETNPTAIIYPEGDLSYFDRFFTALDSAKENRKVIRILHFGDSQIEGDRITGYIREELQNEFGGSGFGLIPAIQIIPSGACWQNYSGAMDRFATWGIDIPRASNGRYGLMAQMVKVYDSAVVNVGKSSQAFSHGTEFTQVRLIFGNNTGPFRASLTANGGFCGEQVVTDSVAGLHIFTWKLKTPATKATINMSGTAEIYGIAFDGDYGVAMDNIPMRGSSGNVFTQINSTLLSQGCQQMDVGMIILQYGGNVMPSITGLRAIEWYNEVMTKEIQHLQRACPNAVILFIGPSDMSKNFDGVMQSYPYLSRHNDSLKSTAQATGIAYWDMFNAMGGENSMPVWVSKGLSSPDYIHFSTKGTLKVGEMFFHALMNDYNAYLLRKRIDNLKQDTIFKKPI